MLPCPLTQRAVLPDLCRAACIFPSVSLPHGLRHQPVEGDRFEVIMAGNLRAVKNPQLAVAAARLLRDDSPVYISSYGDAAAELAGEMTRASHELGHFQWCGKVDHAALLAKMARAHVLLNTSTLEGGANAICEAVTMGLPVVASDIRGNIGMLGEDYVGLFPSNDVDALVAMLERTADDSQFYAQMKEQVVARAPMFAYAKEAASWCDLLDSLSN